MITKVLQISVIYLYLLKCYIYLVTLFQQNHYDIKKFLFNLRKYYLLKVYQYYYYIGAVFLFLNFFINKLYYVTLILLIVSFWHRNTYIIKLKHTKRIIRLSITTLLLLNIITIFLYKINIYFYLSILLLPFIIIIANIINKPIENRIQEYYVSKACQKLKRFNIKHKIAITGSFGKTTTKNILYQILSTNYIVDKTPKSYNTIQGISRSINEQLKFPLDIYLMEMGAFRIGEIEQMSKKFNPCIAIITEIGMQHMVTFKTMDNVTKAKFEIITGLKSDGVVILNYENKYIRKYQLSKAINKNNIYTYGIDYGDFLAKNITFKNELTCFDIYHKDKYLLTINTSMLGRHQILNILCSYCTIVALKKYGINISDEIFINSIRNMKNMDHRLSYRRQDNINIFDDSYSSNIVGFKNAIEVLSNQSGKKIIITPGIVDGGKYDETLNQEVAKIMSIVCDEIYLIDNPSAKIIKTWLTQNKIQYCVFSSFKLAYFEVLSKYNNKEETINLLIENDLPDSFLER